MIDTTEHFEPEPMTVACATSHEHSGDDNQAGTPLALRQCSAPTPASRAVTAPVLSFDVPEEDQRWLLTEVPGGADVLREVRRKLDLLRRIHRADDGVTAACERLALTLARSTGGERGPRGMKSQTLRVLYYNYTRALGFTHPTSGVHYAQGDWRMLWNKARVADPKTATESLAPEFIQFVAAMYDNKQRERSFRRTWEELLHIQQTHHCLNELEWNGKLLKAGSAVPWIPGYQKAWPVLATEQERAQGHPLGWSYSGLKRRVDKVVDNYARTRATQGKQAASRHGLKVHSTKVGLYPLEQIETDDVNFDLKVNHGTGVVRPEGFGALDVLSNHLFDLCFRPMIWDAQEEKRRVLTEKNFLWFHINALVQHGYRSDERGSLWLIENAKATIRGDREGRDITDPLRGDLEKRIYDATGGKVRFERGGQNSAAGHIGQFPAAEPGRGRGNPRHKRLIEGFWAFMHNYLAALPGQIGKDRDHHPEGHGQLIKYNEECRKLMLALPEELAVQVQTPLMFWDDFVNRALHLLDVLADSPHHAIEGWEKCGFAPMRFKLQADGDWMPQSLFKQLAPAVQMEVRANIQKNPGLATRDYWSRKQAYQHEVKRHQGAITKLPLWKIPALVGVENSTRNPQDRDGCYAVRAGVFEFARRELDEYSDAVRYEAVDLHGDRLPNGEKFHVYPFGDTLIVTDAKNTVRGLCPQIVSAPRNDVEAKKRALGRAMAWDAKAKAEIDARHIGGASALAAMRMHNADLRQPRKDAVRDQKLAAFDGEATELMTTPEAVTAPADDGFSAEQLL